VHNSFRLALSAAIVAVITLAASGAPIPFLKAAPANAQPAAVAQVVVPPAARVMPALSHPDTPRHKPFDTPIDA
jgi:hypothetical protein